MHRIVCTMVASLACLACVSNSEDVGSGAADESGSTAATSEAEGADESESNDQSESNDAPTDSEETGGTCLPAEAPIPHTWTVDLEALPEIENDELITGENSIFLELTCPNTTAIHDGSFVDYTIECDHPDAGTVVIGFSIEAGGLPPGFADGPVATSLHIDASVQVGG